MSREWYAQEKEDLVIAEIFKDHVGSLLEIGAWDPEDFSNSRLLLEKGWRGVLVELSPKPLQKLVAFYGNDPKVTIISAAITPCDQHIKRFHITDDALSSDALNTLDRWKGMRPDYDGGFYGNLWVPTITIQKLFDQFFGDHTPDFVSIDTEGTSVEILVELLGMGRRPKVISVEHDGRFVEIGQVAEPMGYSTVIHTQQNMVLLR